MMGYKMSIFFLILIITGFIQWGASSLIQIPSDNPVNGSDLIVIGTVEDISSSWDTDTKNIVTSLSFHVEKVVNGEVQGDAIIIRIPGGTVGNVSQEGEYVPQLVNGIRYGLFLVKYPNDAPPIYGIHDGVYLLNPRNMTPIVNDTSKTGMSEEEFLSLVYSMGCNSDNSTSESSNMSDSSQLITQKPVILKLF